MYWLIWFVQVSAYLILSTFRISNVTVMQQFRTHLFGCSGAPTMHVYTLSIAWSDRVCIPGPAVHALWCVLMLGAHLPTDADETV